MVFKKSVKAGILLYAIVMFSAFTLILQSYLRQVDGFKEEYRAQLANTQAHLMVSYLQHARLEKSGVQHFKEGTAAYSLDKGKLHIKITLGSAYYYEFVNVTYKASPKKP
ncbi:competence type IV pilus minor pilin ComGG [Streptococcus catagoni]|uniref:competence type IV pilus minor pilin ComGG n=1 Tax=Streptococcus catagoni TaxID=2654874 RepID=UPI00140E63A9|nr:competence type IV pilus minor pilin ComGG [Streptococcus catagoni]